jgi:hypothetical protein
VKTWRRLALAVVAPRLVTLSRFGTSRLRAFTLSFVLVAALDYLLDIFERWRLNNFPHKGVDCEMVSGSSYKNLTTLRAIPSRHDGT